MPIPGVGWSAHFRDTEGNKVGLFQDDPSVQMPEGMGRGFKSHPATIEQQVTAFSTVSRSPDQAPCV